MRTRRPSAIQRLAASWAAACGDASLLYDRQGVFDALRDRKPWAGRSEANGATADRAEGSLRVGHVGLAISVRAQKGSMDRDHSVIGHSSDCGDHAGKP
jgi:hypothetical protein